MIEIRCYICNTKLGQAEAEIKITCPNCVRLGAYVENVWNDYHELNLDAVNFGERAEFNDPVVQKSREVDEMILELLDRSRWS